MTAAQALAVLAARHRAFEQARGCLAVPAFASPAAPGFVFFPREHRVEPSRCRCDRVELHRVVDERFPDSALLGWLASQMWQGRARAVDQVIFVELATVMIPRAARQLAAQLRAAGAKIQPEGAALAERLEDCALELDPWAVP